MLSAILVIHCTVTVQSDRNGFHHNIGMVCPKVQKFQKNCTAGIKK